MNYSEACLWGFFALDLPVCSVLYYSACDLAAVVTRWMRWHRQGLMAMQQLWFVWPLWVPLVSHPRKWSNLGAFWSRCRSPPWNASGPAGAVEGVMCPILGGTRKDVFWGCYHLLGCRLAVHEARPTQLGLGLAELRPHSLNFVVFFSVLSPRGTLLLFQNYLFGVLLSFVCLAMLASEIAL